MYILKCEVKRYYSNGYIDIDKKSYDSEDVLTLIKRFEKLKNDLTFEDSIHCWLYKNDFYRVTCLDNRYHWYSNETHENMCFIADFESTGNRIPE